MMNRRSPPTSGRLIVNQLLEDAARGSRPPLEGRFIAKLLLEDAAQGLRTIRLGLRQRRGASSFLRGFISRIERSYQQ
jgi:hypothetical protein